MVFCITDFNSNNKLETLWGGLRSLNIYIKVVGEYEHAPEAERCIRNIK